MAGAARALNGTSGSGTPAPVTLMKHSLGRRVYHLILLLSIFRTCLKMLPDQAGHMPSVGHMTPYLVWFIVARNGACAQVPTLEQVGRRLQWHRSSEYVQGQKRQYLG